MISRLKCKDRRGVCQRRVEAETFRKIDFFASVGYRSLMALFSLLTLLKPRLSPLLAAFVGIAVLFPYSAMAQQGALLKLIAEKNLRDLARSLEDGAYRGEEGILRIKPEVAEAFGMKVMVNQDYQDAKGLYRRAEVALEKAKAAMATKEAEVFPGEHAKAIADNALIRNASMELARRKLLMYRSALRNSMDERLDEAASRDLMETLLTRSLRTAGYQLRDALGHFHNLCRGVNENGPFLTSENVMFVNEIFRQAVQGPPLKEPLSLGLDRQPDFRGERVSDSWKDASTARGFPYLQALEETLKKCNLQPEEVDPLLFIALIKRESGFDPLAVSPSGAVGLTQIIPQTAKAIGMKNIFAPPYLAEAAGISSLERKSRKQALALLLIINRENGLEVAVRARELMQKASDLARQRDALYSQYKSELLHHKMDDRLDPSKAIEFGFKFFLQQLRAHEGDVSLALASYNAGPSRVRQYNGIPPFPETVRFRNKVLEIYKDYLRVLRIPDKPY